MILAATPEERERLPDQQHLAEYWRRWLNGRLLAGRSASGPNGWHSAATALPN